MSKDNNQKRARFFAPVPVEAMADSLLSALDLRALMTIALHDGMSGTSIGTGAGCFAAHRTLAKSIGTDVTNFSKSLHKLQSLGYVVAEPQMIDKRRKTLRAVYVEFSDNLIGETTNNPAARDQEIVGSGESQNGSFSKRNAKDYIPLNGERYSDESGKDIPLSGAIELRAKLGSQLILKSDKAQIAMIERGFKEGHLVNDETYWLDWLSTISENSTDVETIGWAGRVIETYDTSTIDDDVAPW